MTTDAVFREWVLAFAAKDGGRVAACYHEDAVNWQVADEPVVGRAAIRNMMQSLFAAFAACWTSAENVMIDGEWAAWEWVGGGTFLGPLGPWQPTRRKFELRGCGFFHVIDERIRLQRGYWDRAAWHQQIGVPLGASIK